jgi:hypothetical protein
MKDPKIIKKYKSAYILYTEERRPFIKQQYPKLINSRDITRLIAQEWKNLGDADKLKYKEKEKKEKEQFERLKMENKTIRYTYTKYRKPRKPVRHRTPYMFFIKDKKETFKGKSNIANMTELSEQWRLMQDVEKIQYIKQSEEDKKRYKMELDIYVKTFFHLKPNKRVKLVEKSENQLIELFSKSHCQNKKNYQLNDDIKKVMKSRANKFNFEVSKVKQETQEVKFDPESSDIDEIDFEDNDLFGSNIKYGEEAILEFNKMSKREFSSFDSDISEEYSN